MNPEYQQYQKQFQVTRLLAFVMMVLIPFVFVILSFIIETAPQPNEGIRFLFYSLLVIAIVAPFTYPLVERFQIVNYTKGGKSRMSPAQLFTALSIIRCAFVEATFIYGLLIYLLSADRSYMWFFYPIGAAWAAVYWPTEGKFEEFMKKVQVTSESRARI